MPNRENVPAMRSPASLLATVAAVAVAVLAPARLALAATTLVIQHGTREPTTVYADGDHLRAAISGNEQFTAVIMDATAKKLVMIDDRAKTYTEITEEQMRRMAAKMAEVRAQVEEKLKNMPPERRQKVEAMMKAMPGGDAGQSGKPAEWKFEALGQKKTVNGMPCETYHVLVDGKLHEEDCILPWSSKLLRKSDFAGIEKLAQTMTESVGVSRTGGIPLLNRYPGLPISRVPVTPDGARGEEEQVKSIKQGSVPAGSFTVPAGYTKKPLPEGITGTATH
jgi:hypothetical protein